MLLEIAIGDAVGACYEFDLEYNSPVPLNYKQNTVYPDIGGGLYTDDTQMSVAIANIILEAGDYTQDITEEDVLRKIFNTYKLDARFGYSSKFKELLDNSTTLSELKEKLINTSKKNGAAIRACPIGYLVDIADVKKLAITQAKCTHDSPEGIISSQIVALTCHFFLSKRGNKFSLQKFLDKNIDFGFYKNFVGFIKPPEQNTAPPTEKPLVNSCARETLYVVNELLWECHSYTQLIEKCLNYYRGDLDSVLAIVMGIASTANFYNKDIPKELYDNLENGNYGRNYLEDLDRKLQLHV